MMIVKEMGSSWYVDELEKRPNRKIKRINP